MIEALIPVGVAVATGFSVLIHGLHTRVNELDKRVDVFELRVAENYVSNGVLNLLLNGLKQHMIRIENKLDKLTT